jgi:FAD synthetase
MKATLRGQVPGAAAALVGVWDPLLPGHLDLLDQLGEAAFRQGLTPLMVFLDPDPGVLRFGPARWPSYFDLATRIQLVEQLGCSTAIASFSGRGLQSSAAEFLRALRARVRIQELWLGARQPLGPGDSGSPETVARLADRYGMRVVRLPDNDHHATGATVRRLLSVGQVQAAAQKIGRPPTFARPRSGRLELAWPNGTYRALALKGLGMAAGATEMDLVLTAGSDGRNGVDWPEASATHIAFLKGPADCEAAQRKEVTLFRLSRDKVNRVLTA